jgi:hypothetical protein
MGIQMGSKKCDCVNRGAGCFPMGRPHGSEKKDKKK